MGKRGQPTKYNQEIATEICSLISTTSKSMRTICGEVGIVMQTFLNWLSSNEDFLAQYTRAKEQQADFLAEEILDIADNSDNDTIEVKRNGIKTVVENTEWVNRSKLRVEARKWVAAKLKPKKYGDRIDINQNIQEQPLFPDVPKDNLS